MSRIAILGAGMAGFGAAHLLHERGHKPIMFDKLAHFGGHTSSYTVKGFTYDEGPHVSFTKDERFKKILADTVDGQYETIQAKVNNYWRGHWITHPAQVNLHGLPHDLVVTIIKEFVEANAKEHGPINNYEDWLVASFGPTFARTFPMEYAWKYHTTTANNMSTDWLGPRIYRPKLEEVLRGALTPASPKVHYVDDFRYPSKGGFASYLKRWAEHSDLRLGHSVRALDPRTKRISFENGSVTEYDEVVSSMPLPELLTRMTDVPREVREACERLACTEVVLVNVAVKRADLLDAHWSYYYDRDIFFTRLSTPHLLSPNNAPPGCGLLQAECYFSKKYRPLDRTPEACIEPVLASLRKCGLLRESDEIIFTSALHLPYANIIFDLDRAKAVDTVHGYLRDVGVHYCGRYGDWGYLWTDEAFTSGEKAAERALKHMGVLAVT